MDEDELQDDQLEDDGGQEDAPSGSDNSAPPKDESAPKDEGKRVNDLMSKWQQAEARARKAEAALAARDGTQADEPQGDTTNDRVNEFEVFARENARQTLYGSNPLFAQAGLEVDDIAGETLAEMRASAKKHLKILQGMEGRLRNKILAEHGLDPEVATGAGTESVPSFSSMSDEEFAKFMAARDSRPR